MYFELSENISRNMSVFSLRVIRYYVNPETLKVHITPPMKFRPENPCRVKRSHTKNFRNRTWRFLTIKLFQF